MAKDSGKSVVAILEAARVRRRAGEQPDPPDWPDRETLVAQAAAPDAFARLVWGRLQLLDWLEPAR